MTKHKTCYSIRIQNVRRCKELKVLKDFRNSLKLTTQEFADSIEVSKSLYEKVESGDRLPSREFTTKLKKKYPQFDVNIFFITQ